MISLSYIFEQKQSLIKYAFSQEGAKNTIEGLGGAAKDVGKDIAYKATHLGDTVYNATHDSDSGASYLGKLFRTKKAMDLENINAAHNITKGMTKFREADPERADQWMGIAKKYMKKVVEK
jgi:hypothetical protein